jgi:hypothetical protein
MTLTTRLVIVEPTPVKEVFDEVRRIIGAQGARYRHEDSATWEPGVGQYRNEPGQGFLALLWVKYGVDAPMRPEDESEYEPEDRSSWPADEWSIEVCLDTTYGYRGPRGSACSDLHAWIIQQLGRWLDERGLTWHWYHDSTGQWHPSTDPLTILGDPERGRLPDTDAARSVTDERRRETRPAGAPISSGSREEP